MLSRFLLAQWLFYCIIMSTAVSTQLSAKLAIRDFPVRIEKIADLLEMTKVHVYTFQHFFFQNYMKNAPPEMKWLDKRLVAAPMETLLVPHRIYQFMKGEAVLITNKEPAIFITASLLCFLVPRPYHIGKEDFFPSPFIVPFSRSLNRTIAESINIGIIKAGELGIMEYITTKFTKNADKCLKDVPEPKEIPVMLYQLESALRVLGSGLTVAVCVLLVELCIVKILRFPNRCPIEKNPVKRHAKHLQVSRPSHTDFNLNDLLVGAGITPTNATNPKATTKGLSLHRNRSYNKRINSNL